jgi:thiol-disulfide isomerase/thioredoxin
MGFAPPELGACPPRLAPYPRAAMKAILCSLAALVSLLGVSFAAETNPTDTAGSHKLSDFKLGNHIDGPAVTIDQAAGKAVLIEAWGVNCGPCLASLPDIDKIARRYKDRMVVFGAHSQQASDEEVKAVVKKNRLSYTITKGVTSPVSFSGIPRVFVFDTAGSMIFTGNPFDKEFERAIRKSVQGGASSASTGTTGSGLDALKKPSGLDALKKPGAN